MKSLFVTLMLVGSGFGLFAQKLDKAKDLLGKKKYPEAKNEINNYLAQEKNKNSAEGWYTKAKIYETIGVDSTQAASSPGAKDTALEAFKRYMDLESNVKDSAKRYLLLTLDNRRPITDLYAAYSKEAASLYNAGNYNDALKGFQGSLDIFDLLAKNGWTNGINLDTISVLYAGISAEKATKTDTAAQYYARIADAKAKGQGYESIYKWLADHYKQKNDIEKAQKYIKLGREVYPDDPFWSSFEVNMLSESGNKEQLFQKYEELTKANPNNSLYFFNYAVELYKTAYNEDLTKRPANSSELIDKSITNAKKSIEIDPKYPNSRMLLGQIFYNQAVDIVNQNKKIKPQAKVKLTPAQLKEKEDLRQAASKKFDEAAEQLAKVDEILGGQGKLKMEEKQFLKDAYDLLINIYDQKQDTTKSALYTDKFNNVDKVH